ncbi:MAG: alkaline phosphatase family protein [Chloroflexi bacterium]|nr:alkaline phosphatase family protein [Chloroflexota bacterium]
MSAKRVVVLDLVCLTLDHLTDPSLTPNLSRLASEGWAAPLQPPFPAVTCTAQATLTTGCLPRDHGVVCNGLYERDRFTVRFWDQPTSMVKREKLWERVRRERGGRSALLFFQNVMFATADVVVTPAPIHLEHDLVPWCYSKPVGYYERLAADLGGFELHSYWGPLAGVKSSEWIARAVVETARREQPDLLMAYLPHLDYNTQRFGPDSPRARQDLAAMDRIVGEILDGLPDREDTSLVLVSEYAMAPVSRGVGLNQALRQAGLLDVREIGGFEFPDYELSDAFALVDHQMAHVYVKPEAMLRVRQALESTPGVEAVLGREEQASLGIDHPGSGELIAIAEADAWFYYYWWLDEAKVPPFARTVDIHRKPGYDPVELFFDPATRSIPLRPELVKGSHGRPRDRDARRPALIIDGPSLPSRSAGEVSATAFPDLVLSLFDGAGGRVTAEG